MIRLFLEGLAGALFVWAGVFASNVMVEVQHPLTEAIFSMTAPGSIMLFGAFLIAGLVIMTIINVVARPRRKEDGAR